ncbi:8567_t:CDS:2, partial [Cetraspora pellucida]
MFKITDVKWIRSRLISRVKFGKIYLVLNLNSLEVIIVKQIKQPLNPSDKKNEHYKAQDIRAANILVDEESCCKISNFGISERN